MSEKTAETRPAETWLKDSKMWILVAIALYALAYQAFERSIGIQYAFKTEGFSNLHSVLFVVNYTVNPLVDCSNRWFGLELLGIPVLGVWLGIWFVIAGQSAWVGTQPVRTMLRCLVPSFSVRETGYAMTAISLCISLCQLAAVAYVVFAILWFEGRVFHLRGTWVDGVPPNYPSEILGFLSASHVGGVFTLFLVFALAKACLLIFVRRQQERREGKLCLRCDFAVKESPICPECGSTTTLSSKK